MAKQLEKFPDGEGAAPRRYPWAEWTDGGVWEIVRGEDYDVATENMRVNLHMKADSLGRKVQTKKIDAGSGLVFQFRDSEDMEVVKMKMKENPRKTQEALDELYEDALEIYERARTEVTIERKDGRRQKYAPIRFKRQIEAGHEEGTLVPAVARIVRKPTLGFGHLGQAGRPDLMLETLVADPERPYHELFSPTTVRNAEERLREYEASHGA
jgi:hypothetical protein